NGRVWLNDPDVIYTGYDETSGRWNQPPQPRAELVAWISAVALSGQSVETADAPDALEGDRLRLTRVAMPVYRGSARPLDLFTRDLPETLALKVDKPFGGWNVVGLFNWGENSGPDGPIPAAEREIRVDFAQLGVAKGAAVRAYDFWNDKYLGEFKGGFSALLKPREAAVVALQPALARPQFLATNRHITMGATDIKSIAWDSKTKTLSGAQSAVAGFEYHLAFYVPKGYKFKAAKLSAGAAKTGLSNGGKVMDLRFTPVKSGDLKWKLTFN
ncbi:MAG: hypothetical protein WCX65_08395, partial [bacterium]